MAFGYGERKLTMQLIYIQKTSARGYTVRFDGLGEGTIKRYHNRHYGNVYLYNGAAGNFAVSSMAKCYERIRRHYKVSM